MSILAFTISNAIGFWPLILMWNGATYAWLVDEGLFIGSQNGRDDECLGEKTNGAGCCAWCANAVG
jgi:hypothetical protein